MNPSTELNFLNVINGSQRGVGAAAMRVALSAIEPFYAGVTAARNRLYDSGLFPAIRLARPVISIGNLTAGGTGKTPMVRWLAGRLRGEGIGVAILSRGYKSVAGRLGDEQLMLDQMLNAPGLPPVVLIANRDRVAGAKTALATGAKSTFFSWTMPSNIGAWPAIWTSRCSARPTRLAWTVSCHAG